ncbi:hypothetical protein CEXT_409951 [Caerostris extrusa]|uniref:Secreted protein n=1 Tax=Caerostris extrusa TaxID=172846 RepID=A0AAV4XJD8_CAEEX|nr:hypothetical protein CEXT_409951 [Caerostris extrusa]
MIAEVFFLRHNILLLLVQIDIMLAHSVGHERFRITKRKFAQKTHQYRFYRHKRIVYHRKISLTGGRPLLRAVFVQFARSSNCGFTGYITHRENSKTVHNRDIRNFVFLLKETVRLSIEGIVQCRVSGDVESVHHVWNELRRGGHPDLFSGPREQLVAAFVVAEDIRIAAGRLQDEGRTVRVVHDLPGEVLHVAGRAVGQLSLLQNMLLVEAPTPADG